MPSCKDPSNNYSNIKFVQMAHLEKLEDQHCMAQSEGHSSRYRQRLERLGSHGMEQFSSWQSHIQCEGAVVRLQNLKTKDL